MPEKPEPTELSGVLLVGDPHGLWQPIFEAIYEHRPAAVVLLGDMGLVAPLRQVIAPIIQTGATIRWIHGNHDTVEYARLWDDAEDWSLHRRVETIAGRRMAGIGGVFRGRVWFPKNGDEVPVVRTAAELLRHGQEGQPRFRGGVPLRHRDTILPEDLDAVRSAAADGCDILVTHEAPSCCVRHSSRGGQVLETPQPLGFGGLDDLARDVRARLFVHGHHHHRYEGTTRDGIRVVGLGIADSLFLPADEVL